MRVCFFPPVLFQYVLSLSTIHSLAPDEANGGANHSPLLNLDMGEITYNPSFKDLNDSQIHHILEDAMFKPVKRPRRYSHSQFDENEPKHPPFHHHMRLQIRRLVSESKRRRRKTKNLTVNNGPLNDNKIQPMSTIYIHSSPNHPQVTVTTAGESDNDEDGITFSASTTAQIDAPPEEEPQRTLTETVLPWKRDEDENDNDPAKPQEEFPTWVNNRDYYPGYLSPTPTFLESIRDHQPGTSVITESIEEEDECFEPENPQPKPVIPSKAFDEHSFGQVEEDIIKEVMKEAQQDRSSSISHEQRRRMFRSLGRTSPDRFSLTSVRSEDFSRPTSDLSIECPDVVLDLENEEGLKNTKL